MKIKPSKEATKESAAYLLSYRVAAQLKKLYYIKIACCRKLIKKYYSFLQFNSPYKFPFVKCPRFCNFMCIFLCVYVCVILCVHLSV